MSSIKFYLDHPERGKKKQVPIYLFVNIRHKPRISINTGLRVSPQLWDFKAGRMKPQATGSVKFNKNLSNIVSEVSDEIIKSKNLPLFKLKENIKAIAGETQQQESPLFDALTDHARIKYPALTPNRVKHYKTLISHLKGFFVNQSPEFENLDLKFFDSFINYLYSKDGRLSKKMSDTTVNLHIKTLKTFLNWSFERGYHKNLEYKKWRFTVPNKLEQPVLTYQELTKLLTHPISNARLDRVRDLFCFACFTGQRWGDVVSFDKSQLHGNTWIVMQEKENIEVHVPLIGFFAPAMGILKKRKYQMPKLSGQKMNKYLKELGQLVKLKSKVTITRTIRNKKFEIVKSKWEFMTTHMARRTCTTLLLEQGMPPTTVMRITGHKKLETVMKYEHTSTEAVERELLRIAPLIIAK